VDSGGWRWFGKKVVISDNLAQVINYYGPHFTEQPLGTRWRLFAAIAFRILLDFSGYSDIAIGLARMFGITLPETSAGPTSRRISRSSGNAGTFR